MEQNPFIGESSDTNIPESLYSSQIELDQLNIRRRKQLQNDDLYGNFSTIDWMRDFVTEMRDKEIKTTSVFKLVYNNIQTWVLLILTGVSIGILTSFLVILTSFLSDIKRGTCIREWYQSKDICCQGLQRSGEYCKDYISWSAYLFNTQITVFDFILYLSSSILFGTTSMYILQEYSWQHSTGSGLSEIKTILGGFIINGFFSFKTLLIKSTSLILSISSGLTIGKEAPLVHLACCFGFQYQKLFSKYYQNEGILILKSSEKGDFIGYCCGGFCVFFWGSNNGCFVFI
jgi:chloride channel 3/4/5